MSATTLTGLGVLAVLALAGGAVGCDAYVSRYNHHDATCTVTGKDRGMDQDGNSNYRIYTQQCDTLEDVDSYWFGKFDSSNVYGEIQVGKTYVFDVAGPRSQFFSSFANIISVKSAS